MSRASWQYGRNDLAMWRLAHETDWGGTNVEDDVHGLGKYHGKFWQVDVLTSACARLVNLLADTMHKSESYVVLP